MAFKHLKFLNKSVEVIDGKLMINLGEEKGIKEIPEGEYFASKKLDGVLCAIRDGRLLSSTLKDLPNIQLKPFFADLIIYSKQHNLTLTGELYCHRMTFQEIISTVMTKDKEIPPDFRFNCFDGILNDDFDEQFQDRLRNIPDLPKLVKIEQKLISTEEPEKFKELFQKYLKEGYEGLIIKNRKGRYKNGRTTLNEGIGFKFKPYETEDAQIIDVIQATEVRKGAKKKINEMGNSVTSKKKDDRVLIEKASAFLVRWINPEGKPIEFKVSIAEDDDEKKRIWDMREEFRTGKHKVEFRAMFSVGVKDKPRHPTSLRLRMAEQEE